MNIDGSGLKQITNIPEGACQPTWSPDGSRIVFISPCKNNKIRNFGANLFIINADGTGLVPLPNAPGVIMIQAGHLMELRSHSHHYEMGEYQVYLY